MTECIVSFFVLFFELRVAWPENILNPQQPDLKCQQCVVAEGASH